MGKDSAQLAKEVDFWIISKKIEAALSKHESVTFSPVPPGEACATQAAVTYISIESGAVLSATLLFMPAYPVIDRTATASGLLASLRKQAWAMRPFVP